MYIKKETINYFAAKGITVKNHPLSEEEFGKKVWNDAYKWSYDYHKDTVIGFGKDGKYIYPTHDQLDADAKNWADSAVQRKLNDWYNAQNLYIEYDEGENHRIICQKVNVKSKDITIEYVEKLIAKDKKQYNGTFGKFADAMNKVLKAAGYARTLSIYPTTYGIGVWLFYNYKAEQNITDVEKILKVNNIEYYNELSKKKYVYRFKISKKQANINLALSA